jgi:hypothetical protein
MSRLGVERLKKVVCSRHYLFNQNMYKLNLCYFQSGLLLGVLKVDVIWCT